VPVTLLVKSLRLFASVPRAGVIDSGLTTAITEAGACFVVPSITRIAFVIFSTVPVPSLSFISEAVIVFSISN